MKQKIIAVIVLLIMIGNTTMGFATDVNTDFDRYFELVYPKLPESKSYLYIVSVGSNFVDLLAKMDPGLDSYQVGQGDFNGNWIKRIDESWKKSFESWNFMNNGIRCLSTGWYDQFYNQIRQEGTTYGFRNGLSVNNSDKIVSYLDAKGNEAYSYKEDNNIRDIKHSTKFLNGIASIGYDKEKNIYYQLDRNFQPIQSKKSLQPTKKYPWYYTAHKLEQFKWSGNEWRGTVSDDKMKVPVKIMDKKGNILKEFKDWYIVTEFLFREYDYNDSCGHILLAKGSKTNPEYLILKNKLYPYTEYGDIRFDSIRPIEKIEPSRVLDLFEDRMVVRGIGDAQDKVGIMDFDGNWTVEPVFRSIGTFHNGLAPAQDGGGKFGYITKNGTWAVAPIYDAAADFGCGYAAVMRDGIPMYIDDSGVVRKEFSAGTELGQFSERFAWVKENGTYSLLDMEFIPQFSSAYESVTPYCNGMSRVKQGGQELFLDLDGNVKFEVADGAAVSSFRDEFAIQKKDGVVEKIDKSGNVTDTYDQYTNVVDLGNGLMLGETSGGGVEVFDLFGYVLEQHDKTKLAELDGGTVLLVPEEEIWFTGIRKDDYFALWDQSYPQSLLKGNDEIIALLPDENLLYVGGEAKRIDMENVEVTPEVKDERTMVPLRVVSETLGYSVDWKDPDVTVTDYIDGEKKEIRLTMGSTTLAVTDTDGTVRQETMDVAPYEENGRTMVPLRFVAEQLGQQVHWDESGLVLISEAKMEPTPTNIAQYLALWEN